MTEAQNTTKVLLHIRGAKQNLEVINSDLIKQYESKNYWKNVLKRNIAMIRFLASRGLAFCEDDEIIDSLKSRNYLSSIELLAAFFKTSSGKIRKSGQGLYILPLQLYLQ